MPGVQAPAFSPAQAVVGCIRLRPTDQPREFFDFSQGLGRSSSYGRPKSRLADDHKANRGPGYAVGIHGISCSSGVAIQSLVFRRHRPLGSADNSQPAVERRPPTRGSRHRTHRTRLETRNFHARPRRRFDPNMNRSIIANRRVFLLSSVLGLALVCGVSDCRFMWSHLSCLPYRVPLFLISAYPALAGSVLAYINCQLLARLWFRMETRLLPHLPCFLGLVRKCVSPLSEFSKASIADFQSPGIAAVRGGIRRCRLNRGRGFGPVFDTVH